MLVLNRRYYDEYFFNLACEVDQKTNLHVIYDPLGKRWLNRIQANTIVFIQDILSDGICYQRFTDNVLEKISQPVFVVSSVFNARHEIDHKMIKWLHAGSDMLFQMRQYPQLMDASVKTWQGNHFVCLGLLPKMHRLFTASLLLAHGIDQDCIKVDAGPHDNKHWLDFYNKSHNLSQTQCDKLQHGWLTLQHNRLPEHKQRYNVPANHNAMNFNINLRNMYENTAVEMVMETNYFTKGIFFSEKFLNSVYGYNFPIVISSKGSVAYLRSNGFDVFDDIVDHSYDSEDDPLLRIFKAVENNLALITDKEYAIDLWQKNFDRLDQNCQFARYKMYNHWQNTFYSDSKLM